jgi:hypothetical protein
VGAQPIYRIQSERIAQDKNLLTYLRRISTSGMTWVLRARNLATLELRALVQPNTGQSYRPQGIGPAGRFYYNHVRPAEKPALEASAGNESIHSTPAPNSTRDRVV